MTGWDDDGMHEATFHFHDVLNDLLLAAQRNSDIHYTFAGHPAIKDAIEAIGVPHTEVAVIEVNGKVVDFAYGLQAGDVVHVYPHVTHPDVPAEYVQPFLPGGEPRFVLDVHLGKLARFMRTAGFDTLYSAVDVGDAALAQIASDENRIVLSRDTGLLKRNMIRYGYWLRQTQSRAQFREVVTHYGLKNWFKPFIRCPRCNGMVAPVNKADIIDYLPGSVATDTSLQGFVQCPDCKQVYWEGSHYTRMQHFFASL